MTIYDWIYFGVWAVFILIVFFAGYYLGQYEEQERQDKIKNRLARLRAEQGSRKENE
jgi:hypothetical protein